MRLRSAYIRRVNNNRYPLSRLKGIYCMYIAIPHTALPALAEGLEAGPRAAPARGVQRECRRNRTPAAVADFARRTTANKKMFATRAMTRAA